MTAAQTSFVRTITTASIDYPLTASVAVACTTTTTGMSGTLTTDKVFVMQQTVPGGATPPRFLPYSARISVAGTLEVCMMNVGSSVDPPAITVSVLVLI